LLMYKGVGLYAIAGDFIFLSAFTVLMVALAIVAFRRGL